MEKISLITLQFINNYGSVLQTYATQLYFEKMGYTVEIVNYTRENCRKKELKKSMREYYRSLGGLFSLPFVSTFLVKRWEFLYNKRKRIFDLFRNNYLHMSREYISKKELFDFPPEADLYCVGSDQVWNYVYNGGFLSEYFLQYVKNNKVKFSLSSSIGIEKIEENNYKNLIKEWLNDFNLITVREQDAIDILNEIGLKDVYQILDPTLLITHMEWKEILKKSKLKFKNYVLVYQLNPCIEMQKFAEQIANKNGLNIIVISNNIRLKNIKATILNNPKIEDFLWLIDNASYIVTDSFHGTAFSINFNKQFFSWLPSKYKTRISSILHLFGLDDRQFDEHNKILENYCNIDYDVINTQLENERNKTNELIKKGVVINEKK